MGYSVEEDCIAASQALLAASNAADRLASLEELCEKLSGLKVCVLGGSASLEQRIYDIVGECDAVVAADGAVTVALDAGLHVDVVVGDADGRISHVVEANRRGSYTVLHFHGDNRALASYVANLLDNLLVTVQCSPYPPYTLVIPGFTDGERALALPILCRARKLIVLGMNTCEPVGWWSKPWLKRNVNVWPEKKRKLQIAELVFRAFKRAAVQLGTSVEWL